MSEEIGFIVLNALYAIRNIYIIMWQKPLKKTNNSHILNKHIQILIEPH